MSFHLYILLFLFRSGAPHTTLLTAGAFTDTQLPATASHACTTDARLGGVVRVAPQTKILATPVSGCMVSCPRRFLRWPSSMLKTLKSSCHHFVCYSPLRLLFMVPVLTLSFRVKPHISLNIIVLKLKFMKYPAIHTNYIIFHSTTLP